ncbi:hypothetical protein JTE90_024497 [Oedothorax gibbosus]|uniref:Metalloendopeptidase n=1 Tax=Oedothorax gibbosus TaxID=931172 RepID=A0AAV6TRU5_9ARAC|nr:hypothetical protein JTE90_024497 [Oedothorax gibbosus]
MYAFNSSRCPGPIWTRLKPSENRLINKFDFDSIMLYGERTFSKDGWGRSMKAKKKGIKIKDVMAKVN